MARDRRPAMTRPLYGELAPYYDDLFGGVDEACLDFVKAIVPPPASSPTDSWWWRR